MRTLWIACALVILAACSQKSADLAVSVEKSVRTTVVSASTIVEPMVCNPEARKLLTNKPCLALLDVLEPTIDVVIEYNLALQNGARPNIAKTYAAIEKLITAIRDLVPDSGDRAKAIGELTTAGALVQGGK